MLISYITSGHASVIGVFFLVWASCGSAVKEERSAPKEDKLSISEAFLNIPGKYLAAFDKCTFESFKFDAATRREMLMMEEWNKKGRDFLRVDALDSVQNFIEFHAEHCSPDNVAARIKLWETKDNKWLVVTTVNRWDMCSDSSSIFTLSYDKGKWKEEEVIPKIALTDFYDESVLRANGIDSKVIPPVKYRLDQDSDTILAFLNLAHLSCDDSLSNDLFLKLKDKNRRKHIDLVWNGKDFVKK